MKKLLTILFAVALGLNLSAQTVCSNPQDANQDGVIGVDDLMDLLSHWGDTDFDFDGVYDSVDLCTDEGACNYLSNPTEACLYLDAIGACGGDCVEDTDGDGVCDEFYGPCQGQSTVTYQDYTYDLVAIGEQCWFAENLRTETYSNDDVIPGDLSDSEWTSTTSGAVTVYGEGISYCSEYSPDINACDSTQALEEYGRLYNFYAVNDAGDLCPNGWHVPEVNEWLVMADHLGGESVAALHMKTDYGWVNEAVGTNSSGFSGLPGGYRNPEFQLGGYKGYFWTSTPNGSGLGYYCLLGIGSNLSIGSDGYITTGYSVRCLKDTEE